ncbi:hypothetical protein BUALT_Bualt03G0105400 [Buddleja alternifolia]|uniref:Inner centromere protein ARK-binding domain-containing protein n=1 Tax=Buddleja alternifolia TaxID=168488 RepID=A0AAV6Y3G3_9LAMI|nr:hypothetical protein BUALT_Bualt03G0105400 [Buddleja alternifolia]
MTTAEKLFVQIFERKNGIIEKVKQQTELYNQHLASKLLIDGITPPPWLWSPNAASDVKELNKEELISKLLRPYPQPSVRCSVAHYPLYNNPVVTGDNEEFSDGVFMENLAFNKGLNRQDDPTVTATSAENHAGYALNTVPEPDTSVTSPEDQTEERILNIYNAPEGSLAGIQRSKSRQKALELRSSAKALAKSGLYHENITDGFSSQIRFSLSATNQAGQTDELPKLAEPCVIGRSSKDRGLDEAGCRNEEQGMDVYFGSVTRSRSNAEVPVFVRDSLTSGCSSEDCKEDASSRVSEVRKSGPMPISNSEQADNYVNKLPKSAGQYTVCCQSCGDRKLDCEDGLRKGSGIDVYTGRIIRSKISSGRGCCACDSSKPDSSDNCQRIEISMMDCGDDLPQDCLDGSLARVSPANVLNEVCEARESISEDCKSQQKQSDVASWSSSKHNTCVDELCDLDIPSHSAKVDGIIVPSHGRSLPQVTGSNKVQGLVKPAAGLSRRVTRSQTRSDDKDTSEPVKCSEYHSFGGTLSKSGCKQKIVANDEHRNASGSQFIVPCYGTQDILDEHGNSGIVMAREHVLHDNIDQSGSSSSTDVEPIELESQAASVPSDSFVFMEPKLLNFNEIEEDNLRTSTSSTGKGRLEKSPKMMTCSSSDPAVSLDKGIFGDTYQLSLGKQSPEKSDISSKKEEVQKDSIEPDVQENPDNRTEKCGPVIHEYTVLQSFEDDTEAGLNCKNSEVQKAVIMQSKMIDIPDARPKLRLGSVHESLPELQMEEGDWICEGKDKNQLMSNAPEIKNTRLSHCLNSVNEPRPELGDCLIEKVEMSNPTDFDLDRIQQLPAQESQILSCLEGEISGQHSDSPLAHNGFVTCSTLRSQHAENSSLERRSRIIGMESWPQLKRRKIEHEQFHSFTASPSFRTKEPHSSQKGPGYTYLENMKINAETVLMDTFGVNKSTDMEIGQEMYSNLTEGIESPFSAQNGQQVEFCYKEKNERRSSSSPINNEQLREANVQSLPNKEAKSSQGCSLEGTRIPDSSGEFFDAREPDESQCNQHLSNVEKHTDNSNSKNLTLNNTTRQGKQSSNWEGGLQTQLSPSNKDLEVIDVDQSLPVFEGFTVDAEADRGALDFTADEIDFDKLNLRGSTIERASILAEICRSASLDTPLSHFSSAFEFQGTQNLFHSVPNDHLESLDLRSTLPSNSDVGKQLQSGYSFADDYKNAAFEGMPYSDCLPYSGARYGWNSRNQHTSPVGKLWERLSSHSGSSEKRLSSNPELTCFPIEEDPSVSEENKTADDNADDNEEEICSSLAKQGDKRQPLKDLTNLGLNNPQSVSVQEETWRVDSLDFVSTKFSVSGTQDKIQWSPKNQYRDKSETEKRTSSIGASDGRRNQSLSIGTNGVKKAKESFNNSISKPLSKKTTLKRQDQKLSLKESRNNIVSNVSSFIPLVQQKQAAAVCAGKRDVKVKALKAAEAAKRLEEKKENERKMRKEAMELERAKLEEENLRNMELEKKKKEENRKKKDADIIAKKRLREEEERKDKEKKRMRLETRQRQRGQEEKTRADKAGKQKQRSKDEQMNSKKELHMESKKQQNRDLIREDERVLQKAEKNSSPTKVVMDYEECGTSRQSLEAGKVMHTEDKSPNNEDLIVQKNQGKSYEISPYQCSDDEDEEDDELPTTKFVPSWASKSSLALLLPLQQKMDADMIFPPESFCNIDEVLLPRKLQQKQVAA